MSDTLAPAANGVTASSVNDDVLYEVVDGQFVELEPMGAYQTRIAFVLATQIEVFSRSRALGRAVTEMLFALNEDYSLKRRPDVAFVSYDRWPSDRRIPETEAWDVVPNLAVEVVSPTNDFNEVVRKVAEYLDAGVDLVWVVVSSLKQVYVYQSDTDIRVLKQADQLDSGRVLPEFRFSVAELFEETQAAPANND